MHATIDDFRILPAGHCGSGSMRNLIYRYCGFDPGEGVVFGRGSGGRPPILSGDILYLDYPETCSMRGAPG
jgi:hypothetical protein